MKMPLNILLLLLFSIVQAQQKWSLDECITHAKTHNPDVLAQKLRAEITEKDIKISKGRFYPDANFYASQSFFLGNFLNLSTGVNQRRSSNTNFNLATSWSIFNGFSNKYGLKKSKTGYAKSKTDLEDIRFDLQLNITAKYLAILFNKDILKVAEEQVAISKDNLNRLQQLYNKGLITMRELLEIQSTLASDQKEVSVALNNVENSLIDLKELLDIKDIVDFDIKSIDTIEIKEEFLAPVISNRIIDNNPKIKSQSLAIELRDYDLKINKAQFYPRLQANYSYNTYYFKLLGDDEFNNDINNSFSNQIKNNLVHYVGISAIFPLFNRFATKSNFKKSELELNLAKVELESKKQRLKFEIKKAQNDVEAALASLKAAEIAYNTQEKAFAIAQINYKNGAISSYEFLESKAKLIRTTSAYIKAKFDLFYKQKVLEYYLKV